MVVLLLAAVAIDADGQSPNAILRYSTTELLEAQRRALVRLAPEPRVDDSGASRVVVCVSIDRGGQPFAADSATLVMLDIAGRRAVIPRDCPPTYVMAMYTTERAPRGYIDPYYMSVTRIAAPSDSELVVSIDVTQDIRTKSYRCIVKRNGPAWRSECELYATSAGQ